MVPNAAVSTPYSPKRAVRIDGVSISSCPLTPDTITSPRDILPTPGEGSP